MATDELTYSSITHPLKGPRIDRHFHRLVKKGEKVPVTVWGQKLMLGKLKYLRGPRMCSFSLLDVNEISNDLTSECPMLQLGHNTTRPGKAIGPLHSLELHSTRVYDSILLHWVWAVVQFFLLSASTWIRFHPFLLFQWHCLASSSSSQARLHLLCHNTWL